MNEKVLVFPALQMTDYYSAFAAKGGFYRDHGNTLLDNCLRTSFFMDRAKAEEDQAWLQVIPYIVVREACWSSALVYERSTKGGEGRLHGKLSLGIGGHINDADCPTGGWEAYKKGYIRELLEETGVQSFSCMVRPGIAGLIFDPSDDVGKVHFGVVHVIQRGGDTYEMKDPALMTAGWWNPPLITSQKGRFEGWSQIVIEHLL